MSETSYLYSFVPHKHRLMTLVGFIRTHKSDSIVVGCNGPSSTEFPSIFFNNLGIRAGHLHGKMTPELREAALKRFNEGLVNIIFVSPQLLPSSEFTKPKYFLQFDIPKNPLEEIKIII